MSRGNPLVSVYIPTRDRKTLLARAIRSVLNQDYEPLEILVVDDASREDLGGLVEKLASDCGSGKTLSSFKLERASGACAARNVAIRAAKGSLITGLDDDDYFLPHRISGLVAAFDHAACGFVFDGYFRETVRQDRSTHRVAVSLARPAILRALLKRNIVGNQVLTLTARLRELGGYDESLPAWQDYDLWIRLVKAYGNGRPAGGMSYVHTIDRGLVRISGDVDSIRSASRLFQEKHVEYADRELLLCLRLAEMSYGISVLKLADVPDLIRLGEPRFVAAALYHYLRNRRESSSLQ